MSGRRSCSRRTLLIVVMNAKCKMRIEKCKMLRRMERRETGQLQQFIRHAEGHRTQFCILHFYFFNSSRLRSSIW
jgi:hypothetical protein